MLWVGFEPKIPASELAKSVLRALDRAATVTGFQRTTRPNIPEDRIHHNRCENLKSYIVNVCFRTFVAQNMFS
jgi:hypothetical protein